MILPVLLVAMAISASVLTVMATWARVRSQPLLGRTVLHLLPPALVACLFIAYLSTAFPRQHRIYFDEDAYANMILNVGAGQPGRTTLSALPQSRQTVPIKWPIAFPVMAIPFQRWLGPESGPAAFNTVCGGLTVIWLMALSASLGKGRVAAILAAVLFALQPTAVAWYRSGSSDPFSALVSLGALAAAWFAQEQPRRNYWPAVSILLFGIALHARLENVLLLPPVLFLLYRAPRPFPPFVTNGAVTLAAAAAVHAIKHYSTLRGVYLANIPDSSFSIGLFRGNLLSNLQFLLRHAATTGLLSVVAVIAVVLNLRLGTGPCRMTGVLLVFPFLGSVLLLFYTVGQYDAPGESRFLLLAAPMVAAVAGAAFAHLRHYRFGTLGVTAAILALAFLASSWPATEAYLNRQWSSIAREHDTMLEWATTLPKNALVISRLPYFWENLGFYADMPGRLPAPENLKLPVYFYFGIASDPRDWPTGKVPERRIVTEHGALCLFRLN
jgi:hypothetical protein